MTQARPPGTGRSRAGAGRSPRGFAVGGPSPSLRDASAGVSGDPRGRRQTLKPVASRFCRYIKDVPDDQLELVPFHPERRPGRPCKYCTEVPGRRP